MGIEVTRDLSILRQLKTILIVGLGNIGPEYEQTRHNLGFLAVDEFAETHKLPSWSEKKQLQAHVCEGQIDGTKVIIAKPTTLMNNSGQAVQRLQDYFELATDDIVVIHDDIDLDFGVIRTKIGGGHGGHNGIRSIDNAIGEQYARIKLGIANEHRDKIDAGDYVLQRIPKAQWDELDAVFAITNTILKTTIDAGFPIDTKMIQEKK